MSSVDGTSSHPWAKAIGIAITLVTHTAVLASRFSALEEAKQTAVANIAALRNDVYAIENRLRAAEQQTKTLEAISDLKTDLAVVKERVEALRRTKGKRYDE